MGGEAISKTTDVKIGHSVSKQKKTAEVGNENMERSCLEETDRE